MKMSKKVESVLKARQASYDKDLKGKQGFHRPGSCQKKK